MREKHTAYFKKKGNLFCVFRSNLEPILDCFEKCVSLFAFFQNHRTHFSRNDEKRVFPNTSLKNILQDFERVSRVTLQIRELGF
ncbi:MAG: hypothetical protein A3I12_03370 [Gammaproteobacteria bacterium RIFCSPLOWO2_02_FULL_38_11]|nr:MAG: hypothetical protein A3B69_00035 [Gammaproteobacteria bacterium RIFCSPHIGHO2_02_FULL_38_33]OGT24573.1 MAG: hypothetical protein A2W47_02805 [Gammaproteobacteria bacterium RIFCSPHIGHO2_12_38_15]OGT66720.1 MAG: hypothetical protein A3I12_03370 [Gammaproteobacteria bacterium RIFCSPLOWO2_02_FULL_38_11]OGT77356.1 MAG: hypothetical protein A3G71_00895 [Gammaproteobacteria bacterium RIFCSPLOWO2_12_FULL_38_14]